MSASPTKPSAEFEASQAQANYFPEQEMDSSLAPGREALQALLAFSAMYAQIKGRRFYNGRSKWSNESGSIWDVEPFVLDEVLQLVAERARAITEADGVAIALVQGDEIVCRGSVGAISPGPGARLNPDSGFSGTCFRTGQIVRCDDAENDRRVNVSASRRLGARSMVAVPLRGRTGVMGLLEAFSTDAYGFNDSDVRSLNLLGELIMGAINSEEGEEEVGEVAVDDSAELAQDQEARADVNPDWADLSEASPVASSELEPELHPSLVPEKFDPSRAALRVVALVVLIAAIVGAALWWKLQRSQTAAVMPKQISTSSDITSSAGENAGTASAAEPADEKTVTTSFKDKLAVLPQVTGVRHWSSADASTVVVDLQDQVQYEAHRLASPERIYFDLHDTGIAQGLLGKTVDVGDALLERVRIAQPMLGVTRVVLETKGASSFSVSLEPNPYRLVVEVRASRSRTATPHDTTMPDPAGPSNTAAAAPTAKAAAAPKFRIVLDAGHGGWDMGTVGREGVVEKDLVLDVADRLGKMLHSKLGADVLYTRPDDTYVPLESRAEQANEAQADLFVSVHANYSSSPSARGVETYYTNTFNSTKSRYSEGASASLKTVNWINVDLREKVQQSRRLATSIQRALYSMLASRSAGIRDRGVKEASYVVLTGTTMPAILSEISFVSSPSDERNLQSETYRQQIAEALFTGIARYEADLPHVRIASTSGNPSGR